MLKLGNQGVAAMYLGGRKITKAYLGEALVFGASAPPEPVRYTVTLSVDPQGGGTASGGGSVEAGAQVTVTASASSGYTFSGWRENGSIVSTSASYTFTVTGDRSLTAVFAAVIPTYRVTAGIDPEGSGTASGGGTYQQGASVTVTAAPGEGYSFVKWTENGQTVSESTSYTFTVTGDRTLTAVFEAEKTSRLPAGYTEVEYVESTNGQYITTPSGIVSSRLVIEVEPTKSFSGTTTQVFFGYCKYTASVKGTYHTGLFRSSAGILGGVGSSPGQLKTLSTDKSLRRMTFEIDSANNRMILNGTATSITISSSSKNLDMAINLLSEYASSTSAVAFAATPAKLYSYKGYDTGGNLTKEYIPCINPSGVAGLYDSVGKQFYPSASSAAFIAGPAV